MSEWAPSEEITSQYMATRKLEDGRWIALGRLMFHYSIYIDLDETGYSDRYCYPDLGDAVEAFAVWDGKGDPPKFWNRNVKTGRRRDRDGREWIEF